MLKEYLNGHLKQRGRGRVLALGDQNCRTGFCGGLHLDCPDYERYSVEQEKEIRVGNTIA